MKKKTKIVIKEKSTIREALAIIDSGALKIALVVNNDEKLIGTISDGDIRRSILNGFSIDEKVELIVNRNPIVCNINNSKEEILNKAVSKKVYQIPVIDENRTILGIEIIDDLLHQKKYDNKVVLMVGGLGSRLRPLTDDIPKPLLKIGNKPILQTIVENFVKHGFTNFLFSVNYKAHMIENYFGDGSKFGINIEYIHETKRMGTAGSLSFMRKKLREPFFVMNGDLLNNINFEHMLHYHQQNLSNATMGVKEYYYQVPYGVVNINNYKISGLEEKPTYKFFVNAGVYLFSPETLDYVPENEYFDMPTLFEKLINQNKDALSFPIREYWLDIGKKEEFDRANQEYHEVFK